MVIELEGDGARCGNCHLPGHTIKRCKNMECRTAEFCGLLKRHKDDRDRLEKMEKNIAKLDRTIKTLECTLEKRKQTYNSIECGVNRQIEQMLLEEYKEDYFQYGLKNWARLNKDIAFIKRSFGKTWKPNLSEVKKVMEEKRMQQEFNFSSARRSATKRRSSNPVCHNMEQEGIVFPVKKKNVSTQPSFLGMVPSSVEEEEEQLKMVMELSSGKQRNGNDLITCNIDINNGSRSTSEQISDSEVADLLLSFTGK